MVETSLFFDVIIAARSVLLDDETALAGTTTLSLETQSDLVEFDTLTYIEDNFPEFLKTLRYLFLEDQELLLGYYVLAKTQTALTYLHRTTQTVCSDRIRKAMQKLGTYIMLGPPTPEILHNVFVQQFDFPEGKSNLENLLTVPLSEIVPLYASTRSFQRVAEVLKLRRPDVRRVMTIATKVLLASQETRDKAIGTYMFDLIDKADASGQGFTMRKQAKQGNLYVKTPALLGEFRIDVTDQNMDQLFYSRANR